MSAPERSSTPRTLGEIWGAGEGPGQLNSVASATCRCGKAPREYRIANDAGREFVVYIPVDHLCLQGQK